MEDDPDTLVVSISVLILMNLSVELHLRRILALRINSWKVGLKILTRYGSQLKESRCREILFNVLGFMINVSIERTNDDFLQIGSKICDSCVAMLTQPSAVDDVRIMERLIQLLSRLLTSRGAELLLSDNSQWKLISEVLEMLKSDLLKTTTTGSGTVSRCGSACLAACTKASKDARQQITEHPKGLKTLLDLLKEDCGSDESTVGNVALCLSHCAELPKVCKAFAQTNVVMDLLVLARDKAKPTVQHNCAILIAKLCSGDNRHLQRLRELHGLEILNTVLQHVKE